MSFKSIQQSEWRWETGTKPTHMHARVCTWAQGGVPAADRTCRHRAERALGHALDPFARWLTRSINLSIVKPFRRGLGVRHWSQMLVEGKGQCGAHIYMWALHIRSCSPDADFKCLRRLRPFSWPLTPSSPSSLPFQGCWGSRSCDTSLSDEAKMRKRSKRKAIMKMITLCVQTISIKSEINTSEVNFNVITLLWGTN